MKSASLLRGVLVRSASISAKRVASLMGTSDFAYSAGRPSGDSARSLVLKPSTERPILK